MADLLEALIQIKALAETPPRVTGLLRLAPADAWERRPLERWEEWMVVGEDQAHSCAVEQLGVGKVGQDLGRYADIVAVVFGRDPKTQYFRSVLANNLFGCDNVSKRFGHLMALSIDYEAVGED